MLLLSTASKQLSEFVEGGLKENRAHGPFVGYPCPPSARL
jgi:hypothetical protein